MTKNRNVGDILDQQTTFNVGLQVGANVKLSNVALLIGNSTVNTHANSTGFFVNGAALEGGGSFPSGTRLTFAQNTAPTGWTKDTSNYNNHALRIITGAGGGETGGTVDFTTAFTNRTIALSGSIGATTLTTPQIPSHSHSTTTGSTAAAPGAAGVRGPGSPAVAIGTDGAGGGGSHTHPAGTLAVPDQDLAVKYLNVITATKD